MASRLREAILTGAGLKRAARLAMSEPNSRALANLYAAFEAGDPRAHAKRTLRMIRAGAQVSQAIHAHALGDDWFDFTVESLKTHFLASKGFVYLITGPAQAGLTKVGKTAQEPSRRLRSLNTAAVLLPLKLLEAHAVHDRHWVEAQAHRTLASQGVPRAKEFFQATQAELASVIVEVVRQDQGRLAGQGLDSALPS